MSDDLRTIQRRLDELKTIIKDPATPTVDKMKAIGESLDLCAKLDPSGRLRLARKFARKYCAECQRQLEARKNPQPVVWEDVL